MIKFAEHSDKERIQEFIDLYWKNGHPLAVSSTLFDWQYSTGGRLNFVIAELGGKVVGVLGFIETKNYDPGLSCATLWLALWKVNDDAPPGTGIRILRFLEQSVTHDIIGTLGISDVARNIYKALGYKTGHLDHYYIGSSKLRESKVSTIQLPHRKGTTFPGSLTQVDDLMSIELPLERDFEQRSVNYLIKKYQENPFYKYDFFHYTKDCKELVLVAKIISVGSDKVMRVVDAAGSMVLLPDTSSALQRYIDEYNIEYVDLLVQSNLDFSDSLFINNQGDAIIPHYFEPYEKMNASLGYAYKANETLYPILFKGDADQERPNIISWEE